MRALLLSALIASPAWAADDGHDGHDDHDTSGGNAELTLETAPVQSVLLATCTFATECVEGEACAETTFTAQLDGRGGGLTPDDLVIEAQFISESSTTQLLGLRTTGAMSLSGGLFDARHLLTVAATGEARYTVHYVDGPIAITYLGNCE